MGTLVDDSVNEELSLGASLRVTPSLRESAFSSLSSDPHSPILLSSLVAVETTGMAKLNSLIPNSSMHMYAESGYH
jgi:hypothetical protein